MLEGLEAEPQPPAAIEPVSVRSPDGTSIVSFRSGSGPPLLLLAGALMDHGGWDAVAPLLRASRTLYAVDRRGRGASGEPPSYDTDREIEDIFAVVDGVGEAVDVLAHSSGAILALMAAERGLSVRRLVLYEPPIADERGGLPRGPHPSRVAEALAAGDRELALRMFLSEAMGLSDAAIERARKAPYWAGQIALAHTLLYDPRIVREYVFDRERLARVQAPTLLLYGSTSPGQMKRSVEAFASALPHARVEVLEGQGHTALFSAPALLAEKVLRFLDEN